MDNLGIYIQAILKLKDIQDSKKQIISDLPNLEKALQSDNDARVNIIAGLDVNKSKDLIQSQLLDITSRIDTSNIKIGVDVSNNNFNNVNLKPEIKPILDRSVYTELEDYIDEISRKISTFEIVDVSTLTKRIKQGFGSSNAELKDDIAQFVNALKLTPDNQANIVSTYIDVIESIKNTITAQGVYKDSNIEKNIADEIFRYATNVSSVQKQTTQTSQKIVSDLKQIQLQSQETANTINSTFDGENIDKQADNYIHSQNQIRKNFADTIDVVTEAEQYFSQFGEVAVNSTKHLNGSGGLEQFTINVKSATGELEKFHYFLEDIGTENSPEWVFRLTDIQAANTSVQKLIDAQKKYNDKIKAVKMSLTAEIEAIQNAWNDKSSNKYVANDTNIEKLKIQYNETEKAIKKIENADSKTFKSLKANADIQIDKLKQLVTQYHNAEKVATSLRKKDLETVKIDTGNNIEAFVSKINNSKVPIQALQVEINKLQEDFINLDTISSQTDKATALTNLLNELDNANSKFQSLKELFKGFGKSDWFTVNSEQINNISDIATKVSIYQQYLKTTREEWKEQNLYIGNIQAKAASLARALPNIKKPEGFDNWLDEWTKLTQQANRLKTNLDSQSDTLIKIYNIQSQISKLDGNKDVNRITSLNEELKLHQQTLQSLQIQSNVYTNLLSFEQQEQYITKKTVEAQKELNNVNTQAKDKAIQQIEKTIAALNKLNNSKTFDVNSSNSKVVQVKQEISGFITEYQRLLSELQTNPTDVGLETLRSELEVLNNRMINATTSARDFENQLKVSNNADKLTRRLQVLSAQIKTYEAANPKAAKYYKEQFNQIHSAISDLEINPNGLGLDKIAKQFQNIKYEAVGAGKAGKDLLSIAKEKALKFVGWFSLAQTFSQIGRVLRDMINNVIELDSAMTNLKKVTDETSQTYTKFLKNASDQAQQLHSTITDLVEQTSQWAKLGYNLNQSSVLSKASMIYSNVGEVDNEQAVTNIVSAMKAFNIAVEDVMSIPDVYNKLGNEFAVSSANLGSGMSQAATTMAFAGNSFEQVAALLTGAGEILGDDKLEEIGNGMKTVTLRIQNQAGALQDLGEEYEDLVSVSKTQQQIYELTNGTVNIMSETDPNTFRNTYDILKDISVAIEDLNDTQASELIQLLFGKNRANVGTAVLKAFQSGQIEKVYNAALNSAGSAQKEFDTWSESIEAHINTFKAAFEGLSETLVDKGTISGFVDLGTSIINVLNDTIEKGGLLKTLLLSLIGILSVKNFGLLQTTGTGFKLTPIIKNLQKFSELDFSNLKQFTTDLQQGIDYSEAFSNNLSKSSIFVQKQADEIAELCNKQKVLKTQLANNEITQETYNHAIDVTNYKIKTLTTQTQTLAVSEKVATVTTKALQVALRTLANIGITLILSLAVEAVTKYIQASKEAREEAVEMSNTIQEQSTALEELKQKYIELCDNEDDEISKNEQLTEIKQELIDIYGIEENKLAELNLEREEGIALLEKEIALKEKNERGKWLAENADAIESAKRKINLLTVSSENDGWVSLNTQFSGLSIDDIRDELLNSFNDYYTTGNGKQLHLDVGGSNLIERYENLENIISMIGNMADLTDTEKKLRDNLVNEANAIKETLEDNNYQEIFEIFYQFTAENIFDDYISDNKVEDVSKKTFEAWKNSLLKLANGDEYTEKELEAIIENQFPDFTKYFENLENAYSMFGIDDIINDADEGLKKAFINGLSDDELETATKIPDLFKDGLDSAREKIDNFNNTTSIIANVDETSISDVVENVNNKITLIKSIMEDISDIGYISSSTYSDIIEYGDNFADCLEIQDGRLTVNVDKLKELEKQQLRTAKTANVLAISELELKAASYAAHGQDFSDISKEIEALMEENAVYTTALAELESAFDLDNYSDNTDTNSSSSEEPAIVTEFKNALAEKEHLLAMNQISEKDYYDWLGSESKRVYSNLTDYQEDLWKYEEEIYQWRLDNEQELFDKRIENLEKLADKALDKNIDGNGNDISFIDSFGYAREQINSAILETQNRIAKLSLQVGFDDEIESLIENLENLYDKLEEIDNSEIESQITYIESLKDNYSDLMDEKINAIDKQIDSIEKATEAEEKQKSILEAELEVKKAQIALDKAKVKNRLVYTRNGRWELREDTDAVAEAQETLNEKKENLQEILAEEQTSLLEEQKEILETQKENGENQYDVLLKIYEKLTEGNSQTENNQGLVDRLVNSGDINKAISNLSISELKQALDSGLLSVDNKGNYVLDQNLLNTAQNDTKKDTNTQTYTIGQYSGYNTFNELVNAIVNGVYSLNDKVQNITADNLMNSNIQNGVNGSTKDISSLTTNTLNNAPVFNLTMNVTGSVDDTFVPTVRTEVNNMLLEYTQYFGQQYSQEILRRQSK